MLAQLHGNQSVCKPGRVDWHLELAHDMGQSSDVVFVPMSNQDCFDSVLDFEEVRDVGDDEVDAGHVLLGKQHACVDDHRVVPIFDDHHVLADLSEAAERNHSQRCSVHFIAVSSCRNRVHVKYSTRRTGCK